MSQLFEDGKVIDVDGQQLECVSVGYQEDPETHERHTFNYTFRLKSELDAEREESARIKQEMADQEAKAAEENQPMPEGEEQ